MIAKHVAFLAGLALAAGVVRAAEPTTEELKNQISALQARLDAIEKKQAAAAPSNADVTQTVQEILKDAEKRSQLLDTAGDFTAGWDKGFFLKSSDGNFSLRPGVLFQFRNITNVTTGDDDSIQNGFEFRRLRPRLDGNVFSPDLTYSIVFDVARNGGGTSLLDAWVAKKLSPNWTIKAGQFRNSWVHEGDVPDYYQLALERSLVDAVLAGTQTDRVQGIALIYGNAELPVRFEGTYHDGGNSKNTNFEDTNADFGVSGRAEYKFSGKWGDYRDFSARSTKEQLLVIGAGSDWTEAQGSDIIRTTADAQLECPSGWSFYGALNGNIRKADDDSAFDWGVLAQAGYAINQVWEPFIRYDLISVDDDGNDTYNEFTVGVNYYLGDNGSYGQKAKFTLDLLYLPEGAPSDQTGVGVLGSDDAEIVLRTQFQLLL